MSEDTLERAFASTAKVLGGVSAGQLDDATPCASWTVRDLVNHVIGVPFFFAAAAEGGPAPSGDSPDFASGDIVAQYNDGAGRAVKAFRAEGAMDRTMKMPFGEMPGSVVANIAATDSFTHGWDLARATGQPTDLDPGLAEELLVNAKAAFPDSMRGADGVAPFGPEVAAAPGACAADRLAAFLGRRP
jgi:uncharacterized protein (TIGR03086 family)